MGRLKGRIKKELIEDDSPFLLSFKRLVKFDFLLLMGRLFYVQKATWIKMWRREEWARIHFERKLEA